MKRMSKYTFGIMNEIHILSIFESSTNVRITGFTIAIKSQMTALHDIMPLGSPYTFAPDACSAASTSFLATSVRGRLAGTSTSFTWLSLMGSGIGMLSD